MEVGRSALGTGAARGIGRAIAERLVADGLGVSVADLPSSKVEVDAAVSALSARGAALGLAVDVADAESVEAAIAAPVAHFGGLDVMVANAGIVGMVAGIPSGRLETPEDVAGVVSFLASPDAAYIPGQSIRGRWRDVVFMIKQRQGVDPGERE